MRQIDDTEYVARAKNLLAESPLGINALARELGLAVATCQRMMKRNEEEFAQLPNRRWTVAGATIEEFVRETTRSKKVEEVLWQRLWPEEDISLTVIEVLNRRKAIEDLITNKAKIEELRLFLDAEKALSRYSKLLAERAEFIHKVGREIMRREGYK